MWTKSQHYISDVHHNDLTCALHMILQIGTSSSRLLMDNNQLWSVNGENNWNYIPSFINFFATKIGCYF